MFAQFPLSLTNQIIIKEKIGSHILQNCSLFSNRFYYSIIKIYKISKIDLNFTIQIIHFLILFSVLTQFKDLFKLQGVEEDKSVNLKIIFSIILNLTVGVWDSILHKCEHSSFKLKLSHIWLQTDQQVFLIHKHHFKIRRLSIITLNFPLADLQLLQIYWIIYTHMRQFWVYHLHWICTQIIYSSKVEENWAIFSYLDFQKANRIETEQWQIGQSSSPGRGMICLLSSSGLTLRPTKTPIQRVSGALSPGLKWQEREADHPLPASAEVKNTWIYTSTPPEVFLTKCLTN